METLENLSPESPDIEKVRKNISHNQINRSFLDSNLGCATLLGITALVPAGVYALCSLGLDHDTFSSGIEAVGACAFAAYIADSVLRIVVNRKF